MTQDINPYEAPREGDVLSGFTEGLTTTEQVYTSIVMLCSGFMLIGLAGFHFVILPKAKDPSVFYFVLAGIWILFTSLSLTIVLNLYYRSLVTIPTIIQSSILCLMLYFSPIGIWGAFLLYRRLQRARRLESGPAEITGVG